MTQYGWSNAPGEVRGQVEALVTACREHLGEALVGVYLHGSLALGCFNPEYSDLDVLVVTRRGLTADNKRALAAHLLRLSGSPRPVEISVLSAAQLHPWRYPTPFDFHYSESWRDKMENELADEGWRLWTDNPTDPDLAAHITITRAFGLVLVGPPPGEVFPRVPPADYRASILADVPFAQGLAAENPVYTVLSLCRVYAYLVDGLITSKESGGRWALDTLPQERRAVVAAALVLYRGEPAQLDAAAVQAWADWMAGRIRDQAQNQA